MNAMPQLNEAETKFFESRGQEMGPALSEGLPERPEATPETAADAAKEPVKAEAPEPGVERTNKQEKFVPLQALQQERAEKKQLRDELRAYREWQAQLAQRLQPFPAQAAAPLPDPQTKPLDYINHVLGNVQSTTAELQQWRQQQEQAAQQRAAVQQTAHWATAQEQEFAKSQPEYPEAYRYAAEARDRELQSLGYADPAQRAAIVRQNTTEIIHNALQQGRNPAELVWEYAQARGFAQKNKRATGSEEAQAKIAAGLQAAGAKLNQGGTAGDGEISAKDLAGITDPDEFEKAWKKVFGKRR
ncbi:MAG TPA: hypothetical protein VFK21_00570 [Gammaproteobacteria bacterium]|nr:hypothetical protein [Gammaproteobacteria bacterium]